MDEKTRNALKAELTTERNRTVLFFGLVGLVALATMSALNIPAIAALALYCAGTIALYFTFRALFPVAITANKFATIDKPEESRPNEELVSLRISRAAIAALPEPVFVIDDKGLVISANPAAEELIGSKESHGRHFAAVLRAPDVFEAAETTMADKVDRDVEFETLGPVEHSCRATITAIDDHILIFVRDLTAERNLERMRVDFIASASHELRTPLASLIGFIETLRGPAQSDPKAQKKFLKIMQAQAERMQRLVSDLMSLSRIELNEHMAPRDEVDLVEISKDVIDSLEPMFEPSGTTIELTLDGDAPTMIRGDRDELFQTIQNLLDNSMKYGGENPLINLRIGRGAPPTVTTAQGGPGHRAGDSVEQCAARLDIDTDDIIYIQIRDFGPGISRSDLPRLTERFYRVSVEHSVKSGGTGLGLAIVKHIISRHRGGFQIESKIAAGTAFNCYFAAA